MGLCWLDTSTLPPEWGFEPGSLPPLGASPDGLLLHPGGTPITLQDWRHERTYTQLPTTSEPITQLNLDSTAQQQAVAAAVGDRAVQGSSVVQQSSTASGNIQGKMLLDALLQAAAGREASEQLQSSTAAAEGGAAGDPLTADIEGILQKLEFSSPVNQASDNSAPAGQRIQAATARSTNAAQNTGNQPTWAPAVDESSLLNAWPAAAQTPRSAADGAPAASADGRMLYEVSHHSE